MVTNPMQSFLRDFDQFPLDGQEQKVLFFTVLDAFDVFASDEIFTVYKNKDSGMGS